jgi:hypothetical protein
VARKRRMTNDEIPSIDISTRHDIYFAESLQTTIVVKEDYDKDVNDDNIGTKRIDKFLWRT